MKVTVVIPTLNEEAGIGPTIDAIDRKAFAKNGWQLEVLVVDGNSKDRTRAEAEARGAEVLVEPRRGYGRAYKAGFSAATGDYIVTGDADGTYPFERIHTYIQGAIEGELDFVTLNRYAELGEGSMSGKHKLGNWVLTATTRALFWVRIRDSQSGMWVIRRAALPALGIDRLPEGMAFSQEIKVEAFRRKGLRAAEAPGSLKARIGDPVIESWRDGFGNLWALVKRRVRGQGPANP